MQPQQGYLRKLTRFGFALLAIALLTLPASASAVIDAQQATAAAKYRVLIVTAGSKKDAATEAGVDAIKAIGKDTGAGGKFSTFVAGNADQINDQFTATNLARYRAVVFLDTAATAFLATRRRPRSRATSTTAAASSASAPRSRPSPTWPF